MTVSFAPPSGYDIISSFSFAFQPLAKPNSSETWKIGQPKLEIGNKATDWTPAPEDVNNAIISVDNKVTATNNKVATIETNLNSITSKVTSTETKVNTVTNNFNNLQIGGRNLWKFTKEYNGKTYNGWVDNNEGKAQAIAPHTTFNGFGVQRIAAAWLDITQRATIEANTNYTLSA